METFVGDTVRLILKTGINISGFTILEVRFKRPNGTTGIWTASVYSGDNTWMEYITSTADINIAGIWAVQVFVESPTGERLHGMWAEFTVYKPISDPVIP